MEGKKIGAFYDKTKSEFEKANFYEVKVEEGIYYGEVD